MLKFCTVVFLVKFSLVSGRFVKIQPLSGHLSPPKEEDVVKFKMTNPLMDFNSTKARNETQNHGRYITDSVIDDVLKLIILKNTFSMINPLIFKEGLTENHADLNTGENSRYFGNPYQDGFGAGAGAGGYGGNQLMSGMPFMFGGTDFTGNGNNPMMSSLFLMGTLAFVTFLINSILGLVGKLRLPLLGTRNVLDGSDDNRFFRVLERLDGDPRNSKTIMDMEQKIKEAIAIQEENNMKMQNLP